MTTVLKFLTFIYLKKGYGVFIIDIYVVYPWIELMPRPVESETNPSTSSFEIKQNQGWVWVDKIVSIQYS